MDYYGTGRTNYFKVKDVEEFKKWITSFGGQFITKAEHPEFVGIILDSVPDMRRNPAEEGDELIEFDFYEELKSHLQKRQVAVYMESGAEGHRYITGIAVAVCPGKENVVVDIDGIYTLAAKKFRVAEKRITKALY